MLLKSPALVGLGSNQGDRADLLERAVAEISRAPGIAAVRVSRFVETTAVGGPSGQTLFLNAAARFDTHLSAAEVWEVLSDVERRLGRQRTSHWGPRTIDLDLLLFDDWVLNAPDLVVPHPRLAVRRFVLEPAVEVAAEMVHPRIGWTIARLFEHLATAPPRLVVVGANREVRSRFVDELRWRVSIDLSLVWQIADAECYPLSTTDSTDAPLPVPSESSVVASVSAARPKLVVLVEDPTEAGAALRQSVERPGQGPWLTADPADWRRALDDVLAALAGMA